METLSKKPRKTKQIVVRLTNYENLQLKLDAAKEQTTLSRIIRQKLFRNETH